MIHIVISIKIVIIINPLFSNHSHQTLNCHIWAKNIIIAKPLTNHNITGCGISLTNLASQNTQNEIWIIHIRTRVANKYSTQWVATNDTITTAKAQVAQLIIQGLQPKIDVISHTINAACNPIIGSIQATNEKAIASGISAKATVNPDRRSDFNWDLFWNSLNNQSFLYYTLLL